MELICEKYKEKMTADLAVCRHAQGYCKFRSACMIHFMARESAGNAGDASAKSDSGENERSSG